MKRIFTSTLERKCRRWQKILKLADWDITIKFTPKSQLGGNYLARLTNVYPVEKVAVIEVLNDYYKDPGYKHNFNIDILILHELIHLFLWEEFEKLPYPIRQTKAVKEFEEFICNFLSKMIYDIFHKKL
jgi:hypothetical protein